jgi:hypothetical protein
MQSDSKSRDFCATAISQEMLRIDGHPWEAGKRKGRFYPMTQREYFPIVTLISES